MRPIAPDQIRRNIPDYCSPHHVGFETFQPKRLSARQVALLACMSALAGLGAGFFAAALYYT